MSLSKGIQTTVDGEKVTIRGGFYANARDMVTGEDKHVPALWLESIDEEFGFAEPYADLTTGFGEFIGLPMSSYMDGNAYFDIKKFLEDNHIGFNTGLTKHSGFCTYPLYTISPFVMEQLYDKEELNAYFKDFVDEYEYTAEEVQDIMENDNYAEEVLQEAKVDYVVALLLEEKELFPNEQAFYDENKDEIDTRIEEKKELENDREER